MDKGLGRKRKTQCWQAGSERRGRRCGNQTLLYFFLRAASRASFSFFSCSFCFFLNSASDWRKEKARGDQDVQGGRKSQLTSSMSPFSFLGAFKGFFLPLRGRKDEMLSSKSVAHD